MKKELVVKLVKNFLVSFAGVVLPFTLVYVNTNSKQIVDALGLSGVIAILFITIVRTLLSAHDMKKK